MKYTIENIVSILAPDAAIQTNQAEIIYLITDSRRISFPATSLFFALQTKRKDGHIFIKELYEIGLRNFVVKKGFEASRFTSANFIFVENTLASLHRLVAYHRSQFNYPVIGITGSNGKTVVKEWLYQLLSPDYNIVRSPRSYNSQIGVPLSVWQMSEQNNLAIFEAGISEMEEMAALQKIIQPTIGILTNIGTAHDEGFENSLQKATEKIKLFEYTETLFCNEDDENVLQAIPKNHLYKIISWGKNINASIKICSVEIGDLQTEIIVEYKKVEIAIIIPFTDDASIQNAIICFSVLLYLNISIELIQQRMEQLQPVDMRLQLIHGINNCDVINDSYSFDITSFSIALDFLLQQQRYSQKTVIISDLPLTQNVALYTNIIEMLSAKKILRVITIGEQWKQFQPLLKNKIAITEHYGSMPSFIQHFSTNHFKNEAVLLKGARVFGFEQIGSLLERKVHQTLMEINLTAVIHNLKQYQKKLRPGVKLMAMVKAYGYGSGSAEVASVLQFHKVDYLAVAYADEGVELRKAGINLPILVMNVDAAAFDTIIQHQLEPELFSFNIFKSFDSFLKKQGLEQYPVHIKFDTGMHRLGFEEKDIVDLQSLLTTNTRMVVKSAFSHLAASEDEREHDFTMQQAEIFIRCCNSLQQILGYGFIKHIANSAGIFGNKDIQFDMVRLGIGLYGVDSANENQLSLQTVATLKTTIAQLRTVKKGDTIGYNRRGKTLRDSVIATIRIGYADGFSRKLGNGIGHVFINGMNVPVIGSVCMDMAMVDVTDLPNVKEDDEVEIFGKHISVKQFATWSGTIAYEILTNINQRVKRVYVEE